MRPRLGRLLGVTGAGSIALLAAFVGCEPTNEGYEPTQPIPFSHALHAGANKIPCQYCHYSAERSRNAGIPSPSVCMNCHSQIRTDSPAIQRIWQAVKDDKPIEWVRVHRVPDHVYFSHEPHITANVPCERCHGPVSEMLVVKQAMPLTMGFCLDCHRTAPGEFGGPQGAGQSPEEMRAGPLTDCAVCHH